MIETANLSLAELMPDTEITRTKRYRINISTSVKGVKTYEATVDMSGFEMEEVLAESDKLVQQLDHRYPPQLEIK